MSTMVDPQDKPLRPLRYRRRAAGPRHLDQAPPPDRHGDRPALAVALFRSAAPDYLRGRSTTFIPRVDGSRTPRSTTSCAKRGSSPAPDEALIQLTEAFASEVELLPSCESLVEKEAKRRILRAAQEIQQMILDETEEKLDDYISKAQQLIFEATNVAQDSDEIKDLMTVLNKCYLRLVERREGKKPYGLPVRFPGHRRDDHRFQEQRLDHPGRPPQHGQDLPRAQLRGQRRRSGALACSSSALRWTTSRSAIGSSSASFSAFDGLTAAIEITPMDYSTRLNDDQFEMAQSIYNEMYDLAHLCHRQAGHERRRHPGQSAKVKAEHPNLSLIIIDYLQLIKPPPEANKNWALVVGDIVREIRDLAGELDLPIILLSQLNRGVETPRQQKARHVRPAGQRQHRGVCRRGDVPLPRGLLLPRAGQGERHRRPGRGDLRQAAQRADRQREAPLYQGVYPLCRRDGPRRGAGDGPSAMAAGRFSPWQGFLKRRNASSSASSGYERLHELGQISADELDEVIDALDRMDELSQEELAREAREISRNLIFEQR